MISLKTSGISPKEKHIVLTGFMGAGKTTVGQILARRLDRELIDTDEEIEKRQNMTITEIFRQMGEPVFRRLERECIADLCANTRRKVLSLGGGAFMQEETRNICLDAAFVVFLDLSWEAWQERLPLLQDTRPLLQNRPMEEIRLLFDVRRQVYMLSHFVILADQLSPEETADRIIRSITEKYPEFAR